MSNPIVPPAFDCGLCDVIHACHCSRVRYACPTCLPPISVAASNLLAHEVASISRPAAADRVAALPPVSSYAQREGLEPKLVKVQLLRYA